MARTRRSRKLSKSSSVNECSSHELSNESCYTSRIKGNRQFEVRFHALAESTNRVVEYFDIAGGLVDEAALVKEMLKHAILHSDDEGFVSPLLTTQVRPTSNKGQVMSSRTENLQVKLLSKLR
jgi:hypothetical protein